MKKVRTVVLNYNQPVYTLETVEALFRQKEIEHEIVVVDNNSTIENFTKLEQNLSENAFLLRSKENLGYAIGNNIGCKYKSKFKPDYYFIVNNDVQIFNESLIANLIIAIESNRKKNVVAASPLVDTVSLGLDLACQIQVRRILPVWKQIVVNSPVLNKIFKTVMSDYLYKKEKPYANKYTICDSINGCAFLIDANVYEEQNFMDEGTFLYFEEIILGYQLQERGYSCVLDGFSKINHLQGVSTKSSKGNFSFFMEFEKVRSEIYYFRHIVKSSCLLIPVVKYLRYVEVYIKYLCNLFYK